MKQHKPLAQTSLKETTKQVIGVKERLPLSSDYVFKRVFAKDENNSLLKDFLEAILMIEVQKVEVKNPEIPKNIADEKLGILDLKVEVNDDKILDVEMHFIELNKFAKKNPECKTKLEQWLWLIYGKKEEKIKMAMEGNEEIKKTIEILNDLSLSEEERQFYEDRHKALLDYYSGIDYATKKGEAIGLEKGEKIGIAKGDKKARLETAKKMLAKNIPLETIIEITGLTKEEIIKD